MAENVLTRKYGPLPGYAWAGVAAFGTVLWLRHRNASASTDTSTSDTSSTDTSGDTDAAADLSDGAAGQSTSGGDYGTPYDGAGQLYTDLAAAQAGEQSEKTRLTAEQKALAKYKRNHPAGAVNVRTRVFTAHANETLRAIASRFGVTVAELRKANPNLGKRTSIRKGERLHIPSPRPRPAAKK